MEGVFDYFSCARISTMVKSLSHHNKQFYHFNCMLSLFTNIVSIYLWWISSIGQFSIAFAPISITELIWKKIWNWSFANGICQKLSFPFDDCSSFSWEKMSWGTKNHEKCCIFTIFSSWFELQSKESNVFDLRDTLFRMLWKIMRKQCDTTEMQSISNGLCK